MRAFVAPIERTTMSAEQHQLTGDELLALARKLHHAERVMECLRMFYENEFGDDTRDDGEQLDAAVVRYAKLANKLAFKIRKEVYPIARMCGQREMYLEEQKMPPPTKSYMKR